MLTVLSIVVDGVAYGMILFMISVGLSVTMGLMRVINLAHGAFAAIAGALAHWLILGMGMNFYLASLIAVLIVVVGSIPLERWVYRYIYAFDELPQVLATIGLTFIVIAGINLLFGSTLLSIPFPEAFSGTVDVGFRTLPMHRLVVIVVGLMVIAGLYILIDRTRYGIHLRAAVDNRGTASALGIDTTKIYALTFALGAGLAAVGGILGAELLPIDANYPLRYIIYILIVVAVGGLGSITGSFLAALGLGIVDTASRYLVPEYGTVFFFVVMILILAVRPKGLLGRA